MVEARLLKRIYGKGVPRLTLFRFPVRQISPLGAEIDAHQEEFFPTGDVFLSVSFFSDLFYADLGALIALEFNDFKPFKKAFLTSRLG